MGRGDVELNMKLGRPNKVEFKDNFEYDVHLEIGKGMPLDPYFDDPLDVMN